MKLVKFSLVAALAVGSMSVLDAKPLEEAIKDVDISGHMRYRYDSVSVKSGTNRIDPSASGKTIGGKQHHKFRSAVKAGVAMGDGFKAVGELYYNNDTNGGYLGEGTQTKNPIVLKQAYLQYDNTNVGLSAMLGRQELGTIWTADLTGMAAKVFLTPADGLTVGVFAVDSFEAYGDGTTFTAYDGDVSDFGVYIPTKDKTGADVPEAKTTVNALNSRLFQNNMYGAAVLGDFGPAKVQVWGNYWDKTATLYAVQANLGLAMGGGNELGFKVAYLGNAVNGELQSDANKVFDPKGATKKDALANGNLVDVRATAKFAGLDAKIGGIYFGKKEKFTINTLEDPSGSDLYIGRQMFYNKGSWLALSAGQNIFGYVGVGYTLPADIRIGVQGVFGQTTAAGAVDKTADSAANGAGTKYELAADIGYKVNKNLNFTLWYSHIESSAKVEKEEKGGTVADLADSYKVKGTKDAVRFEALYKF